MRLAGDGPQQPLAPRLGLVGQPGQHQRRQGEGGVPQPAVAVVPVADPSELLGERGGGGGHDPAGGGIGQRLQGEQGADHRVLPAALVVDAAGPLAPPGLGVAEGLDRVDAARGRPVRGVPGEHEGCPLALGHGEVGQGGPVLAPHRDRGAQPDRVGPGDRVQRPVFVPHPGDDRAVVEADGQVHPHPHPPLDPLHDPGHVRVPVARGHAVDHPDHPVVGPVLGLQHQGVALVAAADLPDTPGRGEQPAAVGAVAEQGGEAGRRVEPGQAQPVDRPLPAHQPGRVGVADQGVVLDGRGHGATLHVAASRVPGPGTLEASEGGVSALLERRCQPGGFQTARWPGPARA